MVTEDDVVSPFADAFGSRLRRLPSLLEKILSTPPLDGPVTRVYAHAGSGEPRALEPLANGPTSTSSLEPREPSNSFQPSRPTFDQIYDEWFDEVAKWVAALGGTGADRDDVVQEVFIVVHRRLAEFDGRNLPGWLYRIARGKVRDHRRLRWVKRVLLRDMGPEDDIASKDPGPLSSLVTREKQRLLSRLLDELDERERVALVLFEVEGYSGQEIAELHGVPLNTVWTRIHNARKRLGQRLLRIENGIAKRGAK
ncbi:MAG: RNA polymerase sigma factor [Polyangiaceae bacterium]